MRKLLFPEGKPDTLEEYLEQLGLPHPKNIDQFG
jgi:hypothetical protein